MPEFSPATDPEALELLRRFPLFAGLSREDEVKLAQEVLQKTYPAGARLFEVGEPVHGFYLIRRGAVKVFRISPEGKEQILSVFQPGQSFAEAAVFQGGGYPASAECLADSTLLYVSRDMLLRQIRTDPDFALRVIAGLSMKLRRMVQMVEDLTLRDARGRLCRYLLGLAPEGATSPVVVELPVQQTLISRLLGITQETLSRTVKSLVQEGAIETSRRGKIVIHDMSALEGHSIL
ncbi:MAG: Crp/Fnr family transcriptional regulator [Armatimonadetes bacterium]|nr:Crp/Fnr family transcriptional regulator [Armatimonadota bacterium]